MGVVKNYFQKQFQVHMFSLEHDVASDFYMSSCQKNRSAVPLLCVRIVVFLSCLGILLASAIMTGNSMSFGYWPIFLTHWGIIFITVASGSGLVVSLKAYLGGPIDAADGLPWYVKTYWALYNMSIPIAFFISIFYWSLLTAVEDEFAINPVLDVLIHGVNSILMLALLLFSRHPSQLLHFYFPLVATILYLIFSIIYFFAGGTNPFGESYIYPMLDWSNPGEAVITTIGSAVMLVLTHGIVVALSVGRDRITNRYWKAGHSMNVSEEVF